MSRPERADRSKSEQIALERNDGSACRKVVSCTAGGGCHHDSVGRKQSDPNDPVNRNPHVRLLPRTAEDGYFVEGQRLLNLSIHGFSCHPEWVERYLLGCPNSFNERVWPIDVQQKPHSSTVHPKDRAS